MTAASPHDGALVSIIITSLNTEGWIGEAIESALRQEYTHTEVLVVDNGSTDATLDEVARFGTRVHLIREEARSAGAARNAGLDAARGEFVQILDGDDVLAPRKISRQVGVLAASGADVAWEPFWMLERDVASGAFVKRSLRVPRLVGNLVASLLTPEGFLQIGAVLIRRTPLTAGLRFLHGRENLEDVRFLLDLALSGARFVRSGEGEDGLLFRQHDSPRLSDRDAMTIARAALANAELAEQRWREKGTGALDRQQRDALVGVYLFAARQLHAVDREAFDRVVSAAERLDSAYADRLPTKLRFAARLVGYPRAEAIATHYRAARRGLGDAFRGTGSEERA